MNFLFLRHSSCQWTKVRSIWQTDKYRTKCAFPLYGEIRVDMFRMGRWSFWFDVNLSAFHDKDMHEKRFLRFRSPWLDLWPFTSNLFSQLLVYWVCRIATKFERIYLTFWSNKSKARAKRRTDGMQRLMRSPGGNCLIMVRMRCHGYHTERRWLYS